MKKSSLQQFITFILMLTACLALTACAVKSEENHVEKSDTEEVSEKIQSDEEMNKKSNVDASTKYDADKDNTKRKDKADRNITDKSDNDKMSDNDKISYNTEEIDISTVNKDAIQQALNEYKFNLGGTYLDMSTHIKVSDLESLGYSFKNFDSIDAEIKPHEYSLTSAKMEHENGSIIKISVCNPSEATVKFKDADLYIIELEYYDETKYPGYNPDFYIEGAEVIKLNATTLEQFDEITSGMENIDTHDGDNYNSRTIYTQSENYYSRNKYKFTFVDGVLDIIQIAYM